MELKIYQILAAVGVTLVLIQVVMQVIGIVGDGFDAEVEFDGHGDADMGGDGGDGDGHADIGHGNWFAGLLSLKALSAFVGVFGLTGLALMGNASLAAPGRIGLSALAGVAAMWAVGMMMRALSSLQHSGTIDLRHSVGKQGRVYLRIPGNNEGEGKVTVEVDGRQVQLRAITAGDKLPTGAQVRVLELLADETVRVILSVPEEQEVTS